MKNQTQYRVEFKATTLVNGNITERTASTKWYNELDSCTEWLYKRGAKLIKRVIEIPTFDEWVITRYKITL